MIISLVKYIWRKVHGPFKLVCREGTVGIFPYTDYRHLYLEFAQSVCKAYSL